MKQSKENENCRDVIEDAAALLRAADALLIGAGAGMGVDSGLPDFRGANGFWKAYPLFRGRSFSEISNPRLFSEDPRLAWGFFGHRLGLYRKAIPHDGFRILREIGASKEFGYFVFTSNVDGQFHKALFDPDRIVECHGSIHHMQCCSNCTDAIWPSDNLEMDVDMETIRAVSSIPVCPNCQSVARPNILMFGDWSWNARRTEAQLQNYYSWLRSLEDRVVAVIEIGAGLSIPTVRRECESRATEFPLAKRTDLMSTMPYEKFHIRINPRESDNPRGISIFQGGCESLEQIAARFFE